MKKNSVRIVIAILLLWSQSPLSVPPAQVALEVSADAIAKVALYYQNKPVEGNQFDFYLPVNGMNQKFERTSSFFHVVGNVEQVELAFEDSAFILNSVAGGDNKVNLSGKFLYRGIESEATKILRLPTIENISLATQQNGLKIRFSSEFLAGKYTKGIYANTFTLFLKPVI